jgi:hypothetical protein
VISRLDLLNSALIQLDFKMFHDPVMDKGAELTQPGIPAKGMHPVGE